MIEHVFDKVTEDGAPAVLSVVELRMLTLLAEREAWSAIDTFPAPGVVVLDHQAHRPPLDPRARLLEAGAGHLDAAADLDAVLARAAAAQARQLAAFARCRPASWDRQPGEQGAASAATRAARPAALAPVSEWAAAEVAARLRLSQRTAQARLVEAVVLVEQLPATLAALEAGRIGPAHARALVDLLGPVSEEKRAEIEAAALERAGEQTVDNLRARVRRIITRLDAAAALRRLVKAAKGRRVALWAGEDGMATLAADLPQPLARACYQAIRAHALACASDGDGIPDPRSLDERMADVFADLILRPHADRPPVRVDLTLVAGVDTLTGFGPGADQPGEVDGDPIPAPLVREMAYAFGLLSRPAAAPTPDEPDTPEPAATEPGAQPDAPESAAEEASVDWTATEPVPGDAALEERIAARRADEARAAADLAKAIDAENRLAMSDNAAADAQGAGDPVPTGVAAWMAAARAERQAALERLLAAQRLTGTALAHRPRIALVDQLTGTLLALTDTLELRHAATAGRGLGPPPATDGYSPADPLARFVRLRDRRCRFPGCRARARCADLDHQRPYPHGPTAHDNLACLCEHHHRLSHQAPGWQLHRDTDGGLVWTLPGGHTLTTHPPAVGIDDAPTVATDPAPADRTARRRPSDATLQALRRWRPGNGTADPSIPF
jgi:hypothetical protein